MLAGGVMKLAFITAPVMALYSLTLLRPPSATKRLVPEIAMPQAPFKPEIKLELIAVPVVASNSPTLPVLFVI